MHGLRSMLILPALLLSACAPAVNLTQTAIASTQAAEGQNATDVAASATAAAASMTAAAPTATSTPVPPSPTPTEPPGPTPSGVFGFFDVALEQASADTVQVSFGYQLQQGLDLNGVQIMAQTITKGANCNSRRFTVFSRPHAVNGVAVGIVRGADAVAMSMQDPAKCSFKGFTLMVFRVQGSAPVTLFKQDFEMPFELEKK